MKVHNNFIQKISSLLLIVISIQSSGCISYVPLSEQNAEQRVEQSETHLRVTTLDGLVYIFPGTRYTISYTTDNELIAVKGWGDKFGQYGLIDKGYFELTKELIARVEIEKASATKLILVAGMVAGISAVTIIGIKALTGSSESGHRNTGGPGQGE